MGIDWFPRSRDKQIQMVETWLLIFATKANEWNIPATRVTELTATKTTAKDILAIVKSGERTPVSVVQCNEAFNEMETEARFIKKHFLLIPPLTKADYASLLLPLPDEVHTPIPAPAGQPTLTITYHGGPHVLAVLLAPLPGTEPPDNRSDYGYALYRGIMPQGGATLEQAAGVKHYLMKPPTSGDELLHYRFTRRKKELVDFDPSESGMTVYFCSRYENGKGEAGRWGPVVSWIVP